MKQHNLVNINIQSGASLAMRGHVAHKHGGYILEGKFMDVGHQGAATGAELEAKLSTNKDLNSVESKTFTKYTGSSKNKLGTGELSIDNLQIAPTLTSKNPVNLSPFLPQFVDKDGGMSLESGSTVRQSPKYEDTDKDKVHKFPPLGNRAKPKNSEVERF